MTSRSHSRLCVIHLPWFHCTIPSNTAVYTDEILTLLAKVIIISVAIIIEPLLSLRIYLHCKIFCQCKAAVWSHLHCETNKVWSMPYVHEFGSITFLGLLYRLRQDHWLLLHCFRNLLWGLSSSWHAYENETMISRFHSCLYVSLIFHDQYPCTIPSNTAVYTHSVSQSNHNFSCNYHWAFIIIKDLATL